MKRDDESLYCARAISGCDIMANGCICGTCLVYDENQLESGYFCVNGKA